MDLWWGLLGWVRLSWLDHCWASSWPRAIICTPWTQWNLETELEIRDTAIPLSGGLQLSPWTKCLIRNLAPEEAYDLCLHLNSGLACLGNQSSLNIIVSGSPCVMAEAGGHDHIPKGVYHSRVPLSVIVASWLTKIAQTGW